MILIAEDNPLTAEWYVSMFQSAGMPIEMVADGLNVVIRAAAEDYDLIVMDWRLPGQSGMAAAAQIRALPAPHGTVPILVVTGGMTADDIELIGNAKIDGFIKKPFVAVDFIATVKNLSRKSRKRKP